MHYIIYSMLIVLLVVGGLSAYTYADIKEETDNSTYAKNIALANTIFCFLFAISIFALLYTKYLSCERTFYLTLFVYLITGVLFLVNYYFLEQERKDKAGYEKAYENLKNNSNRYNIEFLILSIVLGIVVFSLLLLVVAYTYGKMSNNTEPKQQVYVTKQTTVVDNLDDFQKEDNDKIKRVLIL